MELCLPHVVSAKLIFNFVFCDLDRDDNSIDALMSGVLQKEELYDKWKTVGLDMEYVTEKEE